VRYFFALSDFIASDFIDPVAGVAGVAGVADVFIADVESLVDFFDDDFLVVDFFVDFFMLSCFIESSDFIAGAGVVGAVVWAIAALVETAKTPAIREASSLFMTNPML